MRRRASRSSVGASHRGGSRRSALRAGRGRRARGALFHQPRASRAGRPRRRRTQRRGDRPDARRARRPRAPQARGVAAGAAVWPSTSWSPSPAPVPYVSACPPSLAHASRACSGFEDDFDLVDEERPSRAPVPAPLAAPWGGAQQQRRATMARDRRSCARQPLLRARGPLGRPRCASTHVLHMPRYPRWSRAWGQSNPPDRSTPDDKAPGRGASAARGQSRIRRLRTVITHTVSADAA